MSTEAFKLYRRSGTTLMRPYELGESMTGISVSEADADAGSPQLGDWIARNPDNSADQWLVSAAFFKKQKFEEVPTESVGQ